MTEQFIETETNLEYIEVADYTENGFFDLDDMSEEEQEAFILNAQNTQTINKAIEKAVEAINDALDDLRYTYEGIH